jgi:hypothetical protein
VQEAKENTTADVHHWVRTLLKEWRAGALERGLTLAVGALVVLGTNVRVVFFFLTHALPIFLSDFFVTLSSGLINFGFYTGYGIASLPLHMLQGSANIENEHLTTEYDQLELKAVCS